MTRTRWWLQSSSLPSLSISSNRCTIKSTWVIYCIEINFAPLRKLIRLQINWNKLCKHGFFSLRRIKLNYGKNNAICDISERSNDISTNEITFILAETEKKVMESMKNGYRSFLPVHFLSTAFFLVCIIATHSIKHVFLLANVFH